MNWKNVKTFVLVLLVIVNGYFMYQIWVRYQSEHFLPDSMIENAVLLLKEGNIQIAKATIPRQIPYTPSFEGEYEDAAYFDEVVRKFTGEPAIRSLPPSPTSVTLFSNEGSSFEFGTSYNNKFDFQYTKDGNQKSSTYRDYLDTVAQSTTTRLDTATRSLQYEKIITDFLSKEESTVSLSTGEKIVKKGFRIDSVLYDSQKKYEIVRCTQKLDGIPLHEFSIVGIFEQEEVVFLTGKWMFLQNLESYSLPVYDAVTILFEEKKYLQQQKSIQPSMLFEKDFPVFTEKEQDLYSIGKMEQIYCIYWQWNQDKTSFFFLPAWEIVYQDGTQSIYNAIRGIRYKNN